MDIELKHIHKRFGAVHANNDISAVFHGGQIVGILGENGAGKSTLMKILSGFQPPDSGTILLNGTPAVYGSPEAALAAGIGMLQQDPLDIGAFTVIENFIYGSHLTRREARAALKAQSARLGFEIDPDALVSTLSIGQRQQLEIVRLLALGVKTLILDEPTTGISADQKALLFDALRLLARRDGMSVLLVSHKLEDVIALCDRAVVLRGGRLVGTLEAPLKTADLVQLMFGGELKQQKRRHPNIGGIVASLDGVTLRSRRVTVEHLTLHIRAGEVIGLAGLDNSGQELALRACAGLIKPAAGRVIIHGEDMTGKPYRAFMQKGVWFSAAGRLEEGLIAGLTLTEHVALVADARALIDWKAARALTEAKLARYQVRGQPDSLVETLSGGNQQRLLMGLLPEKPTLLALDQPTRGLDVDSSQWIWTQLLDRCDAGTAILFTSPDLDELTAHSDRLLVACAGRITEVPDAASVTLEQLGRMIGGAIQ
jgi:ABC-type uncharacterized transport system ATPase subunit